MTVAKSSIKEPVHYTTGEVAKMLGCAPRTICKQFDKGQLRGYRVPGSVDRRVPRLELIRFVREYGGPMPSELDPAVFLVGMPATWDGTFHQTIGQQNSLVDVGCNPFKVGAAIEAGNPLAVAVRFAGVTRSVAIELALFIRSHESFYGVPVVGLALDDDETNVDELREAHGFTEVVFGGADAVVAAVRKVLAGEGK